MWLGEVHDDRDGPHRHGTCGVCDRKRKAEGTNPKDLVGATKAPLSLVPPALIIGAAEALANGAEKYGPYNWRDYPVQLMTYLEAAMRHIVAVLDGEDLAPDTGIHHVKHAAAGLGIVLDCLALGTLVDNRPPPGPAARLLAEQDHSTKEKIDGDTATTDASGSTGEEAPSREDVLDRESERLALWGARDCVQCDADRGSNRPRVGIDATRWFGEWYREDGPAKPRRPYDWSEHLYD